MNAINWLIEKSTVETYEPQEFDGQTVETTSWFFTGTLPTRMFFEIKNLSSRETKEGFAGTTEDGIEWSATFGKKMSTKDTVKFTANLYKIS